MYLRKHLYTLGFTGLMLMMACCYDFPRIINLPAQGIHQWRQSDGLSIAWNYYQHGYHFFQPQIMCLEKFGDGHAAGELPLTYYLSACIYSFTGPDYRVMRCLHWLLVCLGLWCFGRTVQSFGASVTTSLLIVGLMFTAPVLVFYTANFLPDAPAFGMALCAIYGAIRWQQTNNRSFLLIFVMTGALAGMLKLTAVLPVVVLICARLADIRREGARIRPIEWLALIGIAAPILICRYWLYSYNSLHHSLYFTANILPIWQLSCADIWLTLRRIVGHWLPVYFFLPATLYTLSMVFRIWKYRNSINTKLYIFGITNLVGAAAIWLLWFKQFRDHDYYIITLLSVPVAIWLIWISSWPDRRIPRHHTYLLLLLVAGGIIWTRGEMRARYSPDNPDMANFNPTFFEEERLQAFLDSIGIKKDALVLSIPDPSPNITLYLLKRQGWTNHTFGGRIHEDTLSGYRDQRGLRYVAVSDSTWLRHPMFQAPWIKPIGIFDARIWFFELVTIAPKSLLIYPMLSDTCS